MTEQEHDALRAQYVAAEQAIGERTVAFTAGALWEGATWEITQPSIVRVHCPHCRPFLDYPGWNYPSGTPWTESQWLCPRVVVAYNEGGHCSTGVCLDCILDAVKGLA